MTKLLAPICFIASTILVCLALHSVVYADAGSGSGSGLGSAIAAAGSGSAIAPVAPEPPQVLVNPTTNPAGYLDQLIGFAKTNWPLAFGLGIYALLELLAALGKNVPALAALGNGRLSLALGGSAAVFGAVLSILVGGGTLQTALFAGIAAIAAYWHPAAPDVAAAKLMKA